MTTHSAKVKILVPVQLPDGECKRLPLVRHLGESRVEVVVADNARDARSWVEFVLPDKILIVEAE